MRAGRTLRRPLAPERSPIARIAMNLATPAPAAPPVPGADPCTPDGQTGAGRVCLAPAPGTGWLRVERVDGASAAVACASTAPLRLLLPRPRGPAAWAVGASLGGGFVGGDAVCLDLEVGEGARALLTTQAETKVYRSTGAGGRQFLQARVGPGGLLALLPEPVSAFAGAAFSQRQEISLAAGASLVLVDALAAGRSARGERWAFRTMASTNQIVVDGRLVLTEALRLDGQEGPAVSARLANRDLLATVVLLGPQLRERALALRLRLDARPATPGEAVLAAASPLADGIHLRLAATGVEEGLAALRDALAFLPELLGEDPLSRRP